MNKVLVIFTGINFSNYMAEYAANWASRNNAVVSALFLKASGEKKEGYGFPSDLDSAEDLSNRKDAEKDDLKLINDYQKILSDLGDEMKVSVSSKIMTDPNLDDVISMTKGASIVLADATYDPNDSLSPKGFTLTGLKEKSRAPVEIIREPDKN